MRNAKIPAFLLALGMTSVMLRAQPLRAEASRAVTQGEQLGAAAQHVQQGKIDLAIRECKAVLAADPRAAPAHMLLGLAYLAQGSVVMMGEAKAELQQALDIDPELLWARFYLARLYLDQGMSEKAQGQLELGLKQSPGLPHLLSLLGEVRRKLGDPRASLELNSRALQADATMTPAHYFLGLAYLDLKQEQAAIDEFQKAIHSTSVTPEMYNSLATLYLEQQKFAEAEDFCRKAIALDRSRPNAYLTLARVYNAQHLSDKAMEAARAALPEGREFPPSEYYQGLQADLAVERGTAYTARKMYAQAIREYIRALDFEPSRTSLHRRLAELYLQNGDPAGAATHTKEAEKLEKGKG